MKSNTYLYPHVVGFAETNLVGNVYYVNYLSWQGRCREMFLRDNAPEILAELSRDLTLVTVQVSCNFEQELFAFDQVIIKMKLGIITQNRITMIFNYYRITDLGEELVAKGEQVVACMRRKGASSVPTQIPPYLYDALQAYQDN
jgi:enediyne core biosynthesis thioesterase